MNTFKCCKICNGNIYLLNAKYKLAQCGKCKIIFCTTVFSQDDFIKVYDKLYNENDPVYKKHSVYEYNMLLENKKIKIGKNRSRLIQKYILKGNCNSVLEIGSGVGLIGLYLRTKNSNIEYVGIEIDKKSFEKSQKLNLNTINEDFTIMAKIERTFDVIMLWEVIEHLQDLNLFIQLAYKKLNKGGRIILSTPNYDKIKNYSNVSKDEIFQNTPPIHLNFFTKENLINIFELNKFSECKARIKKYPYLHLFSPQFYYNMFRAIFNKYIGSTIFFVATKK